MEELVANLKKAAAERIKGNSWMSDGDQAGGARQARQDGRDGRLSGQVPRLFEARDEGRTTFTATSSAARAFEWDYQLSDLGKPVDRRSGR